MNTAFLVYDLLEVVHMLQCGYACLTNYHTIFALLLVGNHLLAEGGPFEQPWREVARSTGDPALHIKL